VTIFAPNIENKQPKDDEFQGSRIIRTNIFIPHFIRKNRIIARAWSMVLQTIITPFIYISYLKKIPIDLILAEHIYSIPPAIVIGKFTKSKIFVDDIITVSNMLGKAGFPRFVRLFTAFEKKLFKRCNDFIHTSPISNKYYKERGAVSTLYVPNGVNCDEFKPIEKESDKIIIFFNGSTYSPQNVEAAANFIKIGKKVNEASDNTIYFSLSCWPEYNLPPSVRDDIKKEKQWLSFQEGVERIADEIGKTDITLLPYSKGHNLTGGVRLKALEYLACGKMVISTSEGIEGIIGLVPNEHFLLAESIDDFTVIISKIIFTQYEINRISTNARKFVLENYDWRVTTTELIERIERF
jgi:glycosyltransferase involved in cell wall biosynthesis